MAKKEGATAAEEAVNPINDNLALWRKVQETNPAYTKDFSRGGGFKGTAINPTYSVMKATAFFGPLGIGWGYEIMDESLMVGTPIFANGVAVANVTIHRIKLRLWYKHGDETGEVIHFGQTQFTGQTKNGLTTDEEAPKKSLTDALTKCLSMLGFSADVHLGKWDDNKYVNALEEKYANGGNPLAAKVREVTTKDAAVKPVATTEVVTKEVVTTEVVTKDAPINDAAKLAPEAEDAINAELTAALAEIDKAGKDKDSAAVAVCRAKYTPLFNRLKAIEPATAQQLSTALQKAQALAKSVEQKAA